MRSISIVLVALLASACSMSKGSLTNPNAPTVAIPNLQLAAGHVTKATADALVGTWEGPSYTTSGGSDGYLVVHITSNGDGDQIQKDSESDGGSLKANGTWTRNSDQEAYTGTVTGNIKNQVNIHIDSPDGVHCPFKATVTVNGNGMVGEYHVNGDTNSCQTDERNDGIVKGQAGTFQLTKQGD